MAGLGEPTMIPSSTALTSATLREALRETLPTRIAINQWENLRKVDAIVAKLKSGGANDLASMHELVEAFTRYHQRELKDASSLIMWEVAKQPGDRRSVFAVSDEIFEEVIQYITGKALELWQQQVEGPLREAMRMAGQTKAIDAIPPFANHWQRNELYGTLRSELDQQGLVQANIHATHASELSAKAAITMRNLTWALAALTLVSAGAAAMQAYFARWQAVHPSPPPLVIVISAPPPRPVAAVPVLPSKSVTGAPSSPLKVPHA